MPMFDTAASIAESHAMIGVASAFIALSWLAVSLRVYVRGVMIRSFGWDDWLMLVALVFFTLESSILIVISWTQLHQEFFQIATLDKLLQYVSLEIAFYICTSIFLKLSLAVFFLRIVLEKWQRWVIYISVTVYITYTLVYLFVALFDCGSPAHILTSQLENKCIGWHILSPMSYIHGSLNALTDWEFAILPIFVLQKTKLPKHAKYSVCFILAVGALGSVASLVRLAYIEGLNPGTSKFFVQAVNIAITSNIEPGLGIIAGSLATVRPLLRHIMQKTQGGWSSTSCFTEGNSSEGVDAPRSESKAAQVDKTRGEFASYGFSEDFDDKFGATTLVSLASSSISPPFMIDHKLSVCSQASEEAGNGHGLKKVVTPPSRPPLAWWHRSARKKETWGDLEEARKSWDDRRKESPGEMMVQPNLLLPDADDEDLEKQA